MKGGPVGVLAATLDCHTNQVEISCLHNFIRNVKIEKHSYWQTLFTLPFFIAVRFEKKRYISVLKTGCHEQLS